MKTYYEVIAQRVLPGIRALIARDLIEVHKLTQKEAARRLGMTQPAISQYEKRVRGYGASTLEKNNEINEKILRISSSIAKNEIKREEVDIEICNLCELVRKKGFIEEI